MASIIKLLYTLEIVFVYCVSNVLMYYPQIRNCKISILFYFCGKGSGLTPDEVLTVSTSAHLKAW